MKRPFGPLVVAALAVLAGCGGAATSPTATGTTTPSGTVSPAPVDSPATPASTASPTPSGTPTATTDDTPATEIPVRNGSLSFDHEQMFVELQSFVGRGASSEFVVTVYDASGDEGPVPVPDPFVRRMLGLRKVSASPSDDIAGIAIQRGAPVTQQQYVFVHEAAHKIQYDTVVGTTAYRWATAEDHQREQLGAAIFEGGADYMASEYLKRHPAADHPRVHHPEQHYVSKSVRQRYVDAVYYYGRRYVDATVDSPAEHWRLYENPPNTTERLLHPRGNVATTVSPLSVDVPGGVTVRRREPMGELFVRLTLWSELNRSRAIRASTGWGNDRLLGFGNGNYAWVLRWDDAANATEFARAFRAYLDARGERGDGVWTTADATFDVRRVGEDAVIVLVGTGSFVRDTTVNGTAGNVTVAPTRRGD